MIGYFSNGTEAEIFRARYCDRCLHDVNEDCPIWLAHLLHNYEEGTDAAKMLDLFIPQRKDGLGNEACRMFVQRPREDASSGVLPFEEAP